MKYLNLLKKGFALELSSEMAYKWNFITKILAMMLMDIVGPLVILLIYINTAGIPGWSFHEFILFEGTLTLVFGFGHLLAFLPVEVIESVRDGSFDKILIKPFNPLLYLTLTRVDLNGIAEMFVGLVLIVWSSLKIGINFASLNFLIYLMLLLLGFLLQYALMIMISALAFLVVKSYGLFDLLFSIIRFARYPLTIYNFALTFFLTFLFPIAISAFYPVEALLRGFSFLTLVKVTLPVIGFFLLTLGLWNLAMKKYTSAGG